MKAFVPSLLSFVLLAVGQSVPALINYQGHLTDAAGAALPTADYVLRFDIYDAATGGTRVWGPQIFDGASGAGHGPKIPVVQGYFNVMLGPTDTDGDSIRDAFTATNRFVQITVAGKGTISPRQQVLSAPYALQADQAKDAANSRKLAGYDWSDLFGVNDPVNGKLPGDKIANETITSTQIADATINAGRLQDGAVTQIKLAPRQVGGDVGVGGVAISAPVTFATSSTVPVDVPDLSVEIATTGRPVFLGLIGEGEGNSTVLGTDHTPDAGQTYQDGTLMFLRDGTEVTRVGLSTYPAYWFSVPAGSVWHLDLAPAGTHVYRVKVFFSGTGRLVMARVRLVAFEL